MQKKICSIVLLAGFSKRMGEPKQHVKILDQTFLQTIISKIADRRASFDSCLFVGQEHDLEAKKHIVSCNGVWLTNPNPETGPVDSIRIALGSMSEDAAFLLWPVDHPMISGLTIEKMIRIWQKNPDSIIVPSDGKRRGHPTIFPADCRRDFFESKLEQGAKSVLHKNNDRIVHMITDDVWTMKNLNTPDLLAEARFFLQKSS